MRFNATSVNLITSLRQPQLGMPSGKSVEVRDEKLGVFTAFVPLALSEGSPVLNEKSVSLEARAMYALGGLNAIVDFLPDPQIFLYSYVRKEAILSSQIEGTQSSLSDLLLFENNSMPGVPLSDVAEVSTYVQAIEYGLRTIRNGAHQIDLALITQLHRILLSKGRGSRLRPGQVRDSQNWVGGNHPREAQYVPPPSGELGRLLADLEQFMSAANPSLPAIRRAAIAHAQFESLHPFYDGNGRIGRMLVQLILSQEEIVREPLLYLSLYLKQHRARYYDRLQSVRESGEWDAWFEFFYTGVIEVALSAQQTAHELQTLFLRDKNKIETLAGRFSGTVLRVFEVFKKEIFSTQTHLHKSLSLSRPTISKAIKTLQSYSIIGEVTGKERNGVYAYTAYIEKLNEGALQG